MHQLKLGGMAMSEKDIKEIYEQLNIVAKPLSSNYNPDEFAKTLMNSAKIEDEISYSVNTTLIAVNQ